MSIAHDTKERVASIDEARIRLIELIGHEHVLTGTRAREFHDPWATAQTPTPLPAFVVQPKDVEEVQAIVRLANELGLPISVSSQGRNYGYGGAAPVSAGMISINLRRMNQVLEIDEQGGFAILEPGVSFAQLHGEIKARGAKLWVSTPDLGWGSVIGNTAEHGLGYTQFGDHAAAVAGMEVVLPDGTLLRTGLWALPNNSLGARAKRGFGPSIDSLFLQSNFGIITKMGIWLTPEPEMFTVGSVILDDAAEIPTLIDVLAPLVQDGTIQGMPLIVSSPEPEGGRCGPLDDTSGRSKKHKMSAVFPPGRVNARVGFYGHPSLVAARETIVRDAVAHIAGATVELHNYPGDVDPATVHPLDLVPAGIPNQFLLDMLQKHFGASVGHFDFSPILPFTGEAAARHESMVMEILDRYDLVAGFGWIAQSRSLIGACMVIFDSADPDEAARARNAVDEMIARAAEWGWSEYRGHVTIHDRISSLYSAGDDALPRFYSRLKDAIDPAGILSPGGHGIWPSTARAQR
ncbi:hypothetical protein DC31_02995 [Microbacterium sp. CH12i]|uniref:FAD-binding oxidoreductase n=1 Tax=Microbacterium sp. CH12i TaxID=1479651 RepID=UPI000460DFEC|nr:FAD-binding oxidoreductase [Microbacterium sp. CH12i]KDA05243.1 hypothetical protein DC31_02995 [Microbacterium sp. CH12i]